MIDPAFKPAGAAMAAIIASLGATQPAQAQPAQDHAAELTAAVARAPAAVPFGDESTAAPKQAGLFD